MHYNQQRSESQQDRPDERQPSHLPTLAGNAEPCRNEDKDHGGNKCVRLIKGSKPGGR